MARTAMVILSVPVFLSIKLIRRGSPSFNYYLRKTDRAISRAVLPVGSLSLTSVGLVDSSVSEEMVFEVKLMFYDLLLLKVTRLMLFLPVLK